MLSKHTLNRHLLLKLSNTAFYRGTIPVLCIVGPRISLQYMGLAFYKPIFEKFEERNILPAHSSAGLAGVCTGITQAVTLGKAFMVPLDCVGHHDLTFANQ